METKICSICEKEFLKTIDFFYQRNCRGKILFRTECINCTKKRVKEYAEKNKDKKIEYNKKYHSLNTSIEKRKQRDLKNRDKIIENDRKRWPEKQKRLKENPENKIKQALRARLNKFVSGKHKTAHTMDLLGCDFSFFKKHIESLFYVREDGTEMNWENYGFNGWHLDHIIPCSFFKLSKPEQQKLCFHYSNIQPLWAEHNLSKSDNLNWENPTL